MREGNKDKDKQVSVALMNNSISSKPPSKVLVRSKTFGTDVEP